MIKLYENDPRDLYEQLASELIRLISEGKLREGDQLPSIRSLASSLQVNTKTVQAAYQLLADKGFILQRKKARAIVQISSEADWLHYWTPTIETFASEAKARGFSLDDCLSLFQQTYKEQLS